MKKDRCRRIGPFSMHRPDRVCRLHKADGRFCLTGVSLPEGTDISGGKEC